MHTRYEADKREKKQKLRRFDCGNYGLLKWIHDLNSFLLFCQSPSDGIQGSPLGRAIGLILEQMPITDASAISKIGPDVSARPQHIDHPALLLMQQAPARRKVFRQTAVGCDGRVRTCNLPVMSRGFRGSRPLVGIALDFHHRSRLVAHF